MITIATNSLYIFSLEHIFEIINSAGFNAVELGLRDKNDTGWADYWNAEYITRLSKKYNIKINTLHVNFDFENDQSDWKEIVSLKNKLKAQYIICHIPRYRQDNYIKWYLENVNNKNILWENVHISKKYEDPIINHWNMDGLKQVCYDIAHAERSGGVCKTDSHDNIKQYHISLWDGTDDHMSLVGADNYLKTLPLAIADYCLELCPKAYGLNNVKKVLIKNRKVLERIK